MTRHLERHGHFRETSLCLGGGGGGIQLIWRHFVLQAAGRSRHLLSATQFVSGCTLQGPQGGHTPIVFHAAVTLCPAACPCKQRQGSSRLTSARGANGALSFSCPCSCVHRGQSGPPVTPAGPVPGQTAETGSQTGLRGSRHRCSQKWPGCQGGGGGASTQTHLQAQLSYFTLQATQTPPA